jgi:hypothetical protein
MADLIDSYSESNYSVFAHVYATLPGYGQSFTGTSGVLNSAVFYVLKNNSPTGNVVAKIYAETHATAFGTDSLPTSLALAISDNIDVSTLPISLALKTFTFSGANKITLTNGTKYFVTIEYSGGNSSNYVGAAYDNSSPTHAGNYAYSDGTWHASATQDMCFYVYNDDASIPLNILMGQLPGVVLT